MKKSLFCIATALMLTGCAEFLPSDDVLEVAPQSFQEYLLRQEDELQEGSSSELPDHEYDADNSSAESAVSPDTGTDTNSDSAGIRQIAAQIFTDDMSDYDKVFAIHQYLVTTVNYDYDNMQANTLPDSVFTAEGALFNHLAVCEGYARAFSALCGQADLTELMISGTADNGSGTISHAWNQVQVDGIWYNMDVTWDDPLVENQIVSDGSNIVYDYFLVPDYVMEETHQAKYPKERHTCNDDRYLESNRQLTIAPYLKEPYFFPSSDTEIWEVAYSCLTSDILEFQIVCDIPTEKAQSKMNLVLDQTQYAMEQIPLYGQISVNAQYGIADYVIVTVTVSPE